MDTYLLHLRSQIGGYLSKVGPFLHHLMFFDEPHWPGGGNSRDKLRAFLLETGRTDLLPEQWTHGPTLPRDIARAFSYWHAKTLGELSNFIVGLCRMTYGRKFQDVRFFPQTMTYFGNATSDAYDIIDTDGDYSWRYDYNNLFGHYSKAAIMRAIHPGMPVCMVTWLGWIRPSIFRLDRVFTDTKYPEGPWRTRRYMGTRAALAMYASGSETGFFNHVGYDPMSARGKDIGGIPTFPNTPFS